MRTREDDTRDREFDIAIKRQQLLLAESTVRTQQLVEEHARLKAECAKCELERERVQVEYVKQALKNLDLPKLPAVSGGSS